MLSRSEVIVLGYTRYGENSIIVRTYSRNYGLMSFIGGGSDNKKGPLRSSMIQPLSQLEVVFYKKSKSDIRRIREAGIARSYKSILFDPVKNCISLFLAEILSHVLHEEEPNEEMYVFISESLLELDEAENTIADFHLIFLYRLTFYLGFKPEEKKEDPYFDLMGGRYTAEEPLHSYFIHGETLKGWKMLCQSAANTLELNIGNQMRRILLKILLDYYRLHIKDFGNLRSLEVLHEVLH